MPPTTNYKSVREQLRFRFSQGVSVLLLCLGLLVLSLQLKLALIQFNHFSNTDMTRSRAIIENDAPVLSCAKEEIARKHDTSIIVISSLIPSHPSIHMINETMNSLQLLRGLSPTTPLYISVDGLPEGTQESDRERLHQYVTTLYQTYNQPHQHVIVSNIHLHIAGNIQQAHRLVKTKYIYIIQHDFPFCHEINHTAMIKTMKEYPDVLRLVKFNQRKNIPFRSDDGHCFGQPTAVDHVNGIHFTKTPGWSDNNHFTTWEYYDEILSFLGNLKRAVEHPMLCHVNQNCTHWGPLLYGKRGDGPYICHLNGRNATSDDDP